MQILRQLSRKINRLQTIPFSIPFFPVGKGQVHEGIIHNSDKGSVITWDFDVMRHDVVFTVYRLRIPLPIVSLKNETHLSSPGEMDIGAGVSDMS